MKFYIIEIILIAFIFLQGKHDGMTNGCNRLMGSVKTDKWHFVGLTNFCLVLAIAAIAVSFTGVWWIPATKMVVAGLIARLSLFDIAYASEITDSKFDIRWIGDEKQWYEELMVKIFGKNGGVKKAIVFGAVLIILNIVNYIL